MIAVRIAAIIAIPFVQLASIAAGVIVPNFFLFTALGGAIISDVLLTLLFTRTIVWQRICWYTLPSLLLYFGSALSIFVLEERFVIISILTASALFQWLYLINLYYLLYKKDKYQEHSFWYVTLSVHVLSFFTFSIALYGLMYYVDYHVSILLVSISVLSGLAFIQQLFITNVDSMRNWRLWTMGMLIIAESSFVIYWLPNQYLAKAFYITIPFFLLCHFGYSAFRYEQQTKLNSAIILLTSIMLLLVVLTTRWR